MKNQLAINQLFQAVVEDVGSFLFKDVRHVDLAGILLPQRVNGRGDEFHDLLACDDGIVDDGQNAIGQFRPHWQAGAKEHQQDRNEMNKFHRISGHTNRQHGRVKRGHRSEVQAVQPIHHDRQNYRHARPDEDGTFQNELLLAAVGLSPHTRQQVGSLTFFIAQSRHATLICSTPAMVIQAPPVTG
jgi:hypothetical protein